MNPRPSGYESVPAIQPRMASRLKSIRGNGSCVALLRAISRRFVSSRGPDADQIGSMIAHNARSRESATRGRVLRWRGAPTVLRLLRLSTSGRSRPRARDVLVPIRVLSAPRTVLWISPRSNGPKPHKGFRRWALTSSNRRPLPCEGRSRQFVNLVEHADLHMYQRFTPVTGSHRFAL